MKLYDLIISRRTIREFQNRSVAEDMKEENTAYRRDDDGTFHVPKRPLNKITHYNKF